MLMDTSVRSSLSLLYTIRNLLSGAGGGDATDAAESTPDGPDSNAASPLEEVLALPYHFLGVSSGFGEGASETLSTEDEHIGGNDPCEPATATSARKAGSEGQSLDVHGEDPM